MAYEEEILEQHFEFDLFHNESQIVTGIARLAIDKGYTNLSAKQQGVIEKFLTKNCSGVTNPGGHHNNCQHVLEGEDLHDALLRLAWLEEPMCESCNDESERYQQEWEKIQAE